MRSKKKIQRICLAAGLAGGALADGLLRLSTGEEGNLLVHSVMFAAGFLIVYGVLRLIFRLQGTAQGGKDKSASEKENRPRQEDRPDINGFKFIQK